MPADPELVRTFGQRWAELGFAETAPLLPPDASIAAKPPRDPAQTAKLPRISLSFAGDDPDGPVVGDRSAVRADLEVRGVLGEGGMGRVHAARQRSLGRDVAVKVLKRDAPTGGAVAALLREAVITGALEHPGIVPVHALGVDDRDMPVLVMKRVEGVEWRQLLHDPRHPAWASRPGDRLITHLEILMQVCQAVHFAHSRGIVHRDIKPENVMLGDYGEVYLVDWGIAVRGDDPAVTQGASGLCGTPAYMAPEMIAGRPVSPRTDVYLLGATLHEILTGELRHPGNTLQDVLLSAFCSEPVEYGPEVPAELARLANRAMARDPGERLASAQELRQAIQDHLEHRGSLALADEARERLAALEALLEASPVDLDRGYRLATECRFGFVQALRAWPENSAARAGLERCLEAAVMLELRQGHVDTAAALMREIERPSSELVHAFEREKRRAERQALEQGRLQALAHDLDTRVAGKQRTHGLAAVLGASLAVSAAALSQPNPSRLRPVTLLVFSLVVLVAMVGIVFALRKQLMQNAFNRRLVGLGLVSVLSLVASRGIATVLGMPAPLVFVQDLLVLSALAAAAAVLLRWIGLLVPMLLSAMGLCIAEPGHSPVIFSLVMLLAVPALAFALWRHQREQEDSDADSPPESELASRRGPESRQIE